MTLENDTNDLSRTMADMQDKTRRLNDSLQTLAEQGLKQLETAVTQTSRKQSAPTRQDSGDITRDALVNLLRQELGQSLKSVLGGLSNPQGAGGLQVIIQNNTGAQVTARESGGMDQKYLEITIDQMVANSLLRGRQTSGVLRTLFGLAPSLLGR
jgi:hypothetical protein